MKLLQRELQVEDFVLDGEYGSEGSQVEKIGSNHFLYRRGLTRQDEKGRRNLPQFMIPKNLGGNGFTLDIPGMGAPHPGHKNVMSYSFDGDTWHPVFEEYLEEENIRRVTIPNSESDQLFFGWQIPMSYEKMVDLMNGWAKEPKIAKYVTLHKIGRSLQGRELLRMEVTDPDSPYPRSQRWVHYVSNEHPGEGKARWRIVGMIRWLLSDDGADFRQRSIWHFVLCMNPDGVNNGFMRQNYQGIDMNRAYRVEGADPSQGHEPYIYQQDIENLMESETPLTGYWDMHVWPQRVDPNLNPGPEFGTGPDQLGEWQQLRDTIEANDGHDLIKPMVLRKPGDTSMWDRGIHAQFGITTAIVEGSGWLYTQEMNVESGQIFMKSLAQFYKGVK